MIEYCIGIDPGKTGAIAAVSSNLSKSNVWSYPGDIASAGDLLLEVVDSHPIVLSAIEKVNSMPGNGVASSFKFGGNYYGWQFGLRVLRIRYIFVTPNKWQSKLLDAGSGENKDTKSRSMENAKRLFPHINFKGSKEVQHGMADALHLGRWAMQEYFKETGETTLIKTSRIPLENKRVKLL